MNNLSSFVYIFHIGFIIVDLSSRVAIVLLFVSKAVEISQISNFYLSDLLKMWQSDIFQNVKISKAINQTRKRLRDKILF